MWGDLQNTFQSIMLFTTIVKLLRLIRFSQLVHQLGALMKMVSAPLASFFMVFFLMFMAFTHTAYLTFGRHIRNYSTFISSFESQIEMLLMKVIHNFFWCMCGLIVRQFQMVAVQSYAVPKYTPFHYR